MVLPDISSMIFFLSLPRFWCRMDQEFYRRHSVTEMKEDSGKSLSAAARRSFFRRKQKHKRSSSKDSKEMVALDAISTDSIPFLDGEENLVEVVQKKEFARGLMSVVCVRLRESGLPEGPEGGMYLSATGTRPRAPH